jgi:hypothetical protein
MKFSTPTPTLSLRRSFLYRCVYLSRWSLVLTLLLVMYFVLSPCSQAFAEESPESDSADVTAVDTSSRPPDSAVPSTPLEAVVVDNLSVSDGSAEGELLPLTDSAPLVTENAASASEAESFVVETPTATTTESPVASTSTDSDTQTVTADGGNVSENTPAESMAPALDGGSETMSGSPLVTSDQASIVPSEAENPVVTESAAVAASSTADVVEEQATATAPVVSPLIHETFSDAEVTFLKSDCVSVEGGSYYCQPRGAAASTRDSLVAEPDADGDLEIFLIRDGEFFQLTHNVVDDAAPFYDGRSETMVWHRFVDDRYRIMEFDFETGAEQTLTDGSYTDMEPTRFGDRVVWQRWVNDRWQVILYDGQEEIQLTTADAHHLAPHIRGEVVLWQSIAEDGSKQLESFDIFTGTHATIADSADATMINPRLMMVYEAVYENGDVVTRGVDLKTGKISPIAALPVELPENLPEPDTTGEVRALLTLKSSQKDTATLAETDPGEGELPLDDMATTSTSSTAVATSSGTMVLDLRTTTESPESLPDAFVATTTDLLPPIPDLVIEPLSTSTQNLE